mmetsp:Transcript_1739/g.3561  ORF Transcript_1739/g.3561 Transcript_1739/m.3561 type:complete len:272 (-) Transcript_1739:356-1171(-)
MNSSTMAMPAVAPGVHQSTGPTAVSIPLRDARTPSQSTAPPMAIDDEEDEDEDEEGVVAAAGIFSDASFGASSGGMLPRKRLRCVCTRLRIVRAPTSCLSLVVQTGTMLCASTCTSGTPIPSRAATAPWVASAGPRRGHMSEKTARAPIERAKSGTVVAASPRRSVRGIPLARRALSVSARPLSMKSYTRLLEMSQYESARLKATTTGTPFCRASSRALSRDQLSSARCSRLIQYNTDSPSGSAAVEVSSRQRSGSYHDGSSPPPGKPVKG